MIVKVITIEGSRQPELPEGVLSYNMIEDRGDTMLISAPEYEAEQERKALKKVAEMVIKEKFDTLSKKDKDDLIPLFSDGHDDDIKVEGGKLVKKIKNK